MKITVTASTVATNVFVFDDGSMSCSVEGQHINLQKGSDGVWRAFGYEKSSVPGAGRGNRFNLTKKQAAQLAESIVNR